MSEKTLEDLSPEERDALAQKTRNDLANYIISNQDVLRRADYATSLRVSRQLADIGLDSDGDDAMSDLEDLLRICKRLSELLPKNNVLDLSQADAGPAAVDGENDFVEPQ